MATVVTSHLGEPHITASQDAQRNIGLYAYGVRSIGGLTIDSSKTIQFDISPTNLNITEDFYMVVSGRYIHIDSGTVIDFTPGATGYSRHDLIVIEYTQTSANSDIIEDCSIKVLQGTPVTYSGTDNAEDPEYSYVDLNSYPQLSQIPILRIRLLGQDVFVDRLLTSIASSMSDISKYYNLTSDIKYSGDRYTGSYVARNGDENIKLYTENGGFSNITIDGSVSVWYDVSMNGAHTLAYVNANVGFDPETTAKAGTGKRIAFRLTGRTQEERMQVPEGMGESMMFSHAGTEGCNFTHSNSSYYDGSNIIVNAYMAIDHEGALWYLTSNTTQSYNITYLRGVIYDIVQTKTIYELAYE